MQQPFPRSTYPVPRPVAHLLGRLPAYPGSLLFVTALNLVLVRHLPADVVSQLEGRLLSVQVSDANIRWDYTWRDGAFRAIRPRDLAPADVVFRASAWDFYCLLLRKEDPDTLFFSRRLVVEGHTELGLLVKNSLDGIDVAVLRPAAVMRDMLAIPQEILAARWPVRPRH